ncbi:hypothetical protein [Microbulbifer thermotolerans]|uniref:hypothetical protein n=1 Tax=Microbulbifer thermotolerans TaxID=252514 RepID=UPI00396A684C
MISRPTTAAHEFGHAIGLGHQGNSATGSIMIYSKVRSVANGTDLQRLASRYAH